MECYDLDYPISLYGNLDTESANVIVIEIVKCTGFDYCKEQPEIDAWLADKALQFGQNFQNYDPETYEKNPVQSSLDFT